MKFRVGFLVIGLVCLVASMRAQTSTTNPTVPPSISVQVPRLIRFSGIAKDETGEARTGVIGITFSLYREEQGGTALWMETQNVEIDSRGRYTVLLGSTKSTGVPAEIFATGEAQWLGIAEQGQAELPRVLMVSVPYALKAQDAQTLGGLPASAFMAAPNSFSGASGASSGKGISGGNRPIHPNLPQLGTPNFIPLWLNSYTLGNSVMFQSPAGNIGVGMNAPTAALDVNGAVNAATSFNLGGNSFAFGTVSNENAFLGFAGNFTTTGVNNTASGFQALLVNTTGFANTATGTRALYANSTGHFNTASGEIALLSNTTGSYNSASGAGALQSNTTGNNNTADGVSALYANTTGSNNTASGRNALAANTQSNNSAFGYVALLSNTTGDSNTAVGASALQSNTIGSDNTAAGYQALSANTTGFYNSAFGRLALVSNTGSGNSAFGETALNSNTTGSANTAVGEYALNSNMTGNSLTCIGYACDAGDGLVNATAIGAYSSVTASNSLVLGNNANVGIGTTAPIRIFTIGQGLGHAISDGWDTYSSRRWKTNIQTLHGALAKVERLRGVSYNLKKSGKPEVGVIAEEVGGVVPEVVTWAENGKDAEGVDYGRLTALLIQATKEQQALIHKQQNQIRAQQAQIKAQQKQSQYQEAQIAGLISRVRTIQAALNTNSRTDTQVRTVKASVAVEHQ